MGTRAVEKKDLHGGAVLDGLRWRYAAKAYDKSKKVSPKDLELLEEAMLLAPSSYGIQAYKIFVVENPEVREKLKLAAYNQPQITDASQVLVFAYKKTLTDADVDSYVERIADVRGQSRESLEALETIVKSAVRTSVESGQIETWSSRQPYIALGFLLETAAMLGIDATPMEGFEPEKVNEILGLTDHSAVVIAAIGYRDSESDWLGKLPKVRKPKSELIERI